MNQKIAFIGAGSMAEAMISGITKTGVVSQQGIFITNKNNRNRLEVLKNKYDIQCMTDKQTAIQHSDIVVLAMKPNDMKEAISSVKSFINEDHLLISVIAGVSTETVVSLIGKKCPVIRAMPNTSASIGRSATAISAGKYAENDHLQLAKTLFDTIGLTVIVEEEKMHSVTSISGSGPAYIYYLVEAMEKAALDAGLDIEVAKQLITQTVIGAGEMLKLSGESAHVLRENITSPSGTTEAGIKALDHYQFKQAVIECVKSAHHRSVELGKVK